MIITPPTNIITDTVRQHLIELLRERHAHIQLEDAIKDLSPQLRGQKPQNSPYSIWQLVEHIRIVQWDILEFCKNDAHKSPKWPQGYWVENQSVVDDETWEESLSHIWKDKEAFIALLNSPEVDLFIPFAYGEGQTLLREALVIADHTSYHTGQIVVIRKILGDWKSG
jgi:uncharacterized damage-inducible protein DinB